MSLEGKTILITRAAHQADDFARRIEQHGGNAVMFPTIEIVQPESWEACDRAIEHLYMYNGLIFVSANGVEFFFRRADLLNVPPESFRSKTIYAVGEKTKQLIETKGYSVTAVPTKFTSLELSRLLQQEDLQGKTFLFPRGNLGDNTLPGNLKLLGANVDSITVYQSKSPPQEEIAHIRNLLTRGTIDILTFTSPSTVKNFVALFTAEEWKELSRRTKIAVIGPVTAKAAEELGLEVELTAKDSTVESLIRAIDEFFQETDEPSKPETHQ